MLGVVHFFLEHFTAVRSFAQAPQFLVPSCDTIDPTTVSRCLPFEQECVGFFADAVQLFGVPRSVGQIYGLLYATPEPLTLADIVERLEISKGSASQGLQLLRTLGAIHEAEGASPSGISNAESQMPSRQVRGTAYVPELGLRKLIGGVLSEQVAPLAASSDARLARLAGAADIASGPMKDFYSKRVDKLSTWRRRLKVVIPVLGTLLGTK